MAMVVYEGTTHILLNILTNIQWVIQYKTTNKPGLLLGDLDGKLLTLLVYNFYYNINNKTNNTGSKELAAKTTKTQNQLIV